MDSSEKYLSRSRSSFEIWLTGGWVGWGRGTLALSRNFAQCIIYDTSIFFTLTAEKANLNFQLIFHVTFYLDILFNI